jgi:hypothetical protein
MGDLLPTDNTSSSRIYLEWNYKQYIIVSFLLGLEVLCYRKPFKLLTYWINYKTGKKHDPFNMDPRNMYNLRWIY